MQERTNSTHQRNDSPSTPLPSVHLIAVVVLILLHWILPSVQDLLLMSGCPGATAVHSKYPRIPREPPMWSWPAILEGENGVEGDDCVRLFQDYSSHTPLDGLSSNCLLLLAESPLLVFRMANILTPARATVAKSPFGCRWWFQGYTATIHFTGLKMDTWSGT